MEFGDAPPERLFRQALRAWLERVVPALGPAPVSLEARRPWWQRWQRELRAEGYAGLAWPREYGGGGAGVLQQAVFVEECDRAGAPERLNILGEGLVGPTLIEFGTDLQKQRFLSPMLDGAHVWCQLFSEPGAGSDLASLRTRARRDGPCWRIDGQKVWSSRAQIADYGILLARTGEGGRHRGITFFLLDMKSSGVRVRPLRHLLGGSEFNEVFLDDVAIPDEMVVGGVDDGWRVAMATLAHERVALATGRVNTRRAIDDLIDMVRASVDADGRPLGADPAMRQKVADLYSRVALQRLTGLRILTGMALGQPAGPEASIAKLFTSALVEDLADCAVAAAGLAGQEEPEDVADGGRWLRLAYQARGTSIAGGTTFVQKNIVAERVLGLPRT